MLSTASTTPTPTPAIGLDKGAPPSYDTTMRMSPMITGNGTAPAGPPPVIPSRSSSYSTASSDMFMSSPPSQSITTMSNASLVSLPSIAQGQQGPCSTMSPLMNHRHSYLPTAGRPASIRPPSRPAFAIMTLADQNVVRTFGFPAKTIEAIDLTLSRGWKGVTRKHSPRPAVQDWELLGAPWEGGVENVRSRRLVEFLLFSLSKVGWHLSSSCELPGRDRDTLFFKQGPMIARAYFSIGFDDENTHSIKMIDAPNDAKQVFLDTLAEFPGGLAGHHQPERGCLEAVLKTDPFNTMADSELGGQLMCALLYALDGIGYELVSSISLGRKPPATPWGAGSSVDTWFLAKKI